MAIRFDSLYDIIVELEEKIEEGKLKRCSVEANAITLANVYKLMINFDKAHDIISEEEWNTLVFSD